MSAKLTKAKKLKVTDKAKSVVVLCLGDKVLRDISRDATRASMWIRLELLYTAKHLTHKLFLK
ncbi:hypothetical protein MTR_3g023190 [Medicago truncatula]|uniref:Uncharacterized protein n=1 Tax=Medicago truncatula TaxID=3880 RepID=G7J1P1_MEDTR|nr:hypothetical protein MTR_3g023190 [Medicago truncatula]